MTVRARSDRLPAGAGIGAATALSPAADGAVVALVARRRDRVEGPVEKIRAESGKALAVEAGITEQDRAAAAVEHVVAQLGGLAIPVPTRRLGHPGPHAALPHLLRAAEVSPAASRTRSTEVMRQRVCVPRTSPTRWSSSSRATAACRSTRSWSGPPIRVGRSRRRAGDQSPSTATTAAAKPCGSSCGTLCPTSKVRCAYAPVNFLR
ncbi:SDR family NAD(P)-dependent oxidoreductase [Streptomyces sp. NPDC101234]|uniref:SDR family NAD(P)-dependent oxidoreductase n=1 Tax=Streptomyces sp. NPDC101234 TaxID=3366138 RepID=UPI0037FAE11D